MNDYFNENLSNCLQRAHSLQETAKNGQETTSNGWVGWQHAGSISPGGFRRFRPRVVLSAVEEGVLSLFRWQLQQRTGSVESSASFEGMLQELTLFQRSSSLAQQQRASFETMVALAGPIPSTFQAVASKASWGPGALAWFTKHMLRFLVGEMSLTQRKEGDRRAGGVLIERCTVLEQSGCKGLCVHMCKLPTEKLFAERWGIPLHMAPNLRQLPVWETAHKQLTSRLRLLLLLL
ncbi:MAG: hypothetical protein SGPRY_003972 [Prymnesium sp.]